jgi:putative MATE family efflux protein
MLIGERLIWEGGGPVASPPDLGRIDTAFGGERLPSGARRNFRAGAASIWPRTPLPLAGPSTLSDYVRPDEHREAAISDVSAPAEVSPPAAAPSPARPLWLRFLYFLGPMMVGNILQAMSGTVNSVYLGQMIGVDALAAVSAFFPILFFFISFVIGLGAGSSVLIGQAFGAREPERVKAVAGTTLTVTLIAAVVVAVLGGLFTRDILVAVGTPAQILSDAVTYARIMLIGMPLFFGLLLMTSMMRGVGDTMTALYTFLIANGIGLLVTPALIRGWLGLPRLGVASAAVGSFVSLLIALAWLFFYLRARKHPLAPDAELWAHLRIEPRLLMRILQIGVPTGIQVVLLSVAEVAVLSFVNGFGADATAAYGTVNQIVSYVQFPAISIAITVSILGAQAIGAGRTDQLGHITTTGILYNLVVTGSLVLLAYVFSRTMIGFFITSEPVLELAQRLLHITLWSYVIFGMAGTISGIMRASGTVLWPTAISIFAVLAVEVPVAWFLSGRIGIDGIWIAYPIAFSAMLVMQLAYYWLVWRRKRIARLI